MSDTLGNIKDAMLLRAPIANLFNAKFGSLIETVMKEFTGKIPVKYHKISSIVSGSLVAVSPFLFRFMKKKQLWIFYVLVGAAEVVSTLLTEKEKQPRTIVYSSL
ncbi:MAG: hypothetical protein ACJ75J_02595 [Cytophagaceae bacterium]